MKWHIDKKQNGAHILHMSVDGGLNFSTVVNQSNNKSIQLLGIREAITDILDFYQVKYKKGA
jgi:hypothetical protein